jgi:hypothetical protein
MKCNNTKIGAGLKSILISAAFSLLATPGFAQSIPTESLYLGQTPPGNTPKIFPLFVQQGFFAAERIAISNDGRDIYYSGIKGYYPIRGENIKRYSFSDGKWTGPFDLFEGYAPALSITGADTTALSLGRPLNTGGENLDFFVSRDESFMIVTNRPALGISYRNSDGSWTNPRNFGPKINFGLGSWGPWVTTDNKYLFYSTGTKPDYSDVAIYWVRIDGMIDSIKHTILNGQ